MCLFLLDAADQPFGKVLVIHDHHVTAVYKKIHPVSAPEHIKELRYTKCSHNTILLVLKSAEPDLCHLDFIFVYDSRFCEDCVSMS